MRKIISLLLCTVIAVSFSACGKTENNPTSDSESGVVDQAEDMTEAETQEEAQNEIVLAVKDAEIRGQGIDENGEKTDTIFDSELEEVIYFGTDSQITYTVSGISEGSYDVYLNMGKAVMTGGSTMVSFAVDEETAYAIPTAIESCAEDQSDIYSMGLFLMKKNVSIQEGNEIVITGLAGHEVPMGEKIVSCMPSIGDIVIYPAGEAVATGYNGGKIETPETKDEGDVLSGMNIAWLGSSVTYGLMANGYSMADTVKENHSGVECYKYAISGTTLVNEDPTSYVERMKQIDPEQNFDLFIVQLSTNDATGGKEPGNVSESTKKEDFDDTTIAGAMEYIISYVDEVWGCPVIFYTGTVFESEEYSQMVDLLFEIKDKWGIGVIDLWNDEEMREVAGTEKYDEYMADPVHPTHTGYEKWWAPKFDQYLTEYVSAK